MDSSSDGREKRDYSGFVARGLELFSFATVAGLAWRVDDDRHARSQVTPDDAGFDTLPIIYRD
jgi:hypothetical protein